MKTLLSLLLVALACPLVGQPVSDSLRVSQPPAPAIRYEAGLHVGPLVSFALNGFQFGQQPVGFMVKRVGRKRFALRLGYDFRGRQDLRGLSQFSNSPTSDSTLLRSYSYRYLEHTGRLGMEYRIPLRKGICLTVGMEGLLGWSRERNQWWEQWGRRVDDPSFNPFQPVLPLSDARSLTEMVNRQGLYAGLGWSFGLWVPLGKRLCLSTQTRMEGFVQDLTLEEFERTTGATKTSRSYTLNLTSRNLISDITLYYRW